MTRGVLDTSVLIAPDVHPLPGELAVSVTSLAELTFGVLVASEPDQRAHRLQRLSRISRRFSPFLPVDDAVAESYGHLAARVAGRGRQHRGRAMDLLIAATAHAHGATLYTRNAKDLHGLEDLLSIVEV